MNALQPYMKAVVAFFAPGLLILGNALVNGDPVTWQLAGKALGAALVAGMAVYATPNRDPRGEHQDQSGQGARQYVGRHSAGGAQEPRREPTEGRPGALRRVATLPAGPRVAVNRTEPPARGGNVVRIDGA